MFDIADFTHIRPHDIRDRCCIVVGAIQTLRVKSTEGRRVYAHNEDMEPHFTALPAAPPGLERSEGGGVKYSFANLLHIRGPPMIVDEAHNAVTGLTREMQARANPCAAIEFTATPRAKSNVLFNVPAAELKRAGMIKLPIALAEHDSLPGVKHWIRNVAQHPASFRLPTAAGRFYPDFVAQLEDGRLLAAEYKGALLADGSDTREKRVVGELWERESAGRCLFAMVEKDVAGKDMRRQLPEKTGAA